MEGETVTLDAILDAEDAIHEIRGESLREVIVDDDSLLPPCGAWKHEDRIYITPRVWHQLKSLATKPDPCGHTSLVGVPLRWETGVVREALLASLPEPADA